MAEGALAQGHQIERNARMLRGHTCTSGAARTAMVVEVTALSAPDGCAGASASTASSDP
jgi:hypothetical protein